VETEYGRKLHVLRTDNNDGEFTVVEFASYCADEGVLRHYSLCLTRSRTTSSSDATSELWGWLGLSSRRGECRLSSGRGGGDSGLHPQPLVHQGAQRNDDVRGLPWAQVDGLSPTGLRLSAFTKGLATSASSTTGAPRGC
jgi:hypothetical protein